MICIYKDLYFKVLDIYNIALIKKYKTKKGENAEKVLGYYGDLETLLKKAIDIQIKYKYQDTKLVGLLKELKAIHKSINKIVENPSIQTYINTKNKDNK